MPPVLSFCHETDEELELHAHPYIYEKSTSPKSVGSNCLQRSMDEAIAGITRRESFGTDLGGVCDVPRQKSERLKKLLNCFSAGLIHRPFR